jgi:hypothetical protein
VSPTVMAINVPKSLSVFISSFLDCATQASRNPFSAHGEPVEPWALHPSIVLRMSDFPYIGSKQNYS